MLAVEVPAWWLWVSGLYFIISILWSVGLVIGVVFLAKKAIPVLTEARTQVRRVTTSAKGVAAKASSTADIVHAQTQNLLGNANTTGNLVTKQARTVGAALTGILVASRVISFVRRIF